MTSQYSQYVSPPAATQARAINKKYTSESGTVISNLCNYTTAAILTLATLAGGTPDVRQKNTQVQTTVSNNTTSPAEQSIPVKNTLAISSKKLQKEFGFKTAQWASVLKVERKTLYNWIKNPDTKIQGKVVHRLSVFENLSKEMDKGHANYLASFAFGRHRNTEVTTALTENNLSLGKILAVYENLYSEFDGKHKRNKYKNSMYS